MRKEGLILFFVLVVYIFPVSYPGIANEDKVEHYLKLLNGPGDKSAVIEWLGLLKSPRAIPYIARLLELPPDQQYDISDLIECLGRIGHPDGIIPIIKMITTKDYYDSKTLFGALQRIDSTWMNRKDVRVYIPAFISSINSQIGSTNSCGRYSIVCKIRFLAETAPQQAIPFAIRIIKKCDQFNIDTLEFVADFLIKEKVNRNEFQQGLKPLIKKVFESFDYPRENKHYMNLIAKLFPEWKNSNEYKKYIEIALKKIETESFLNQSIDTTIRALKVLSPCSLPPILVKLIKDPLSDPYLKRSIIPILGEIAPKEYSNLFIAGLKDQQDSIRDACIEALAISRETKAIPYLIDLAEKNPNIQIDAILAIGKMNSRDSITPLMNMAIKSRNRDLAILAMIALSAIKPNPPAKEILDIAVFHLPQVKYYKGVYFKILSKINDPEIIKFFRRFNPHEYDPNDAFIILQNLLRHNDKQLLPVFEKGLDSTFPKVRMISEYGSSILSNKKH